MWRMESTYLTEVMTSTLLLEMQEITRNGDRNVLITENERYFPSKMVGDE